MKDLNLLRCVAYSAALAIWLAGLDTAPTRRTSDTDTDTETDTDSNGPSLDEQIRCLEQSLSELLASSEVVTDDETQSRHQHDASAIQQLAASCKSLCNRVLSAVHSTRGPKRISTSLNTWRPSHPALRSSRQTFELRKLSERLHDLQVSLTSQLAKTLSVYIAESKHQLRQLHLDSRRFQCHKSDRLKTMSNLLRSLEATVRSLQQGVPNSRISPDEISLHQTQLQQLGDQKRYLQRDHAVLRSLSFRSNVARHDTIPEAHQKTFSWVFSAPQSQNKDEPPPESSCNLSLQMWLERGHGIFWVSGKPGAGKSTLVKFIADHEGTRTALARWSAPKQAAIVCHYFWCAGTPMQRSHAGLLQTLLFQMLRQLPDAIENLLPEHWGSSNNSWSIPELYQALYNVVQRDDLPVRFCFFIDGLDEFDGDHGALCRELLALARLENVKLCLSSRPWSVFEEAFGFNKTGHLRLHDVTKNDIVDFVLDRFAQDPEATMHLTPSDVKTIALEVSRRSQGVFLWVSLATKSLLEALTQDHSPSGLLDRLRRYPPELDDLFMYNLGTVPTGDQATMATSLLITEAAKNPLDVGIYHFHAMENVDPDYVLALSPEPPGRLEYRRQLTCATHQLEVVCRGLLTVDPKTRIVSCIHRTVRDYLDQPATKSMLRVRAPPGFSTSLCLIRAIAAWTKTSRAAVSDEPRAEYLSSVMSLLAAVAQLRRLEDMEACRCLIDNLDDCLVAKGPGAEESLQILRTQIVGHRLWWYLSDVQARRPGYFNVLVEVPALVLALILDYKIGEVARERRRPPWDEAAKKTIVCLLDQGQDPNRPFSTAETLAAKTEKTPWVVLCEHVLPHHEDIVSQASKKVQSVQLKSSLETGILAAFLSYGADARARCERPGKSTSVAATDYMLHAFRLCGDGEDEVLQDLYLQHVHWFAPKDPEHLNAVMGDFLRLVDRARGQQRVPHRFLQQVSEKLLEVSTELKKHR